ncbi:MAG: selenocysteine-specific translation elongation factor [Acetobacteraceae bacterium]
MIIGTAGHIDHGKTSLVRVLTGIDTDRLPEEKARGITLDLGFAYVALENGGTLGFVDVPGHERLVHTMIAGAASIGMALLVVAADDGVMPQTREHLQILSLLGVTRGVVALTKTDLVDADRAVEVELDILALLEGTPLAGAEVFSVSAATGAGVAALRARLLAEATQQTGPAGEDGLVFRLAVDRCFSLAGAGTVVTGSVVSGSVRTGDMVLLLPSGLRARVRGIHAANRAVDHACPGERCALNLIGPGVRKSAIGRGDWVVDPARAAMTQRCDVLLRLLKDERAALRPWTPVLLHHGAAQVVGRVVPLEPQRLAPNESGLAQLLLDRPLPLRHGDRLVLRDIGATRTIAGGRALDPGAPDRNRRRPVRLATLRALSQPDPHAALRGWLAAEPMLRRDALLAGWGLTEAGLASLAPACVALGGWIAAEDSVGRLAAQVTAALAAFHARVPGAPGMTDEALRVGMETRLPREAFAALLAHLAASGTVVADGHLLRAPSHRGGLSGPDARVWEALRSLLASAPYRPPLLREAAAAIGVAEVPLRRACKGFARLGLVVEVAPDRFFLRAAVAGMAEAAHALSAEVDGGWFTASQFRDRLGNGRQLAIQVLEYFDRRGVTVRRGDLRRGGKSLDDPVATRTSQELQPRAAP